MEIREEEDQLFAEWIASRNFKNFIPDGIVCPDTWESKQNKSKVLFVLRDMNNQTENRDLRNDLKNDGSGWKTWNNIARWSVALLDENAEYPWHIPSEERAKQLSRVAVMNIKKDGGGARTNLYELEESAKRDSLFIQKQVELYQPDIKICCGMRQGKYKSNMQLFREYVLNESTLNKNDNMVHGYEYYEAFLKSKKMVPVIEFYHPQVTCISGNRRGHENLFIPLFNDMKILRNKLLE